MESSPTTETLQSDSVIDSSLESFVRWGSAQLGLDLTEAQNHVCHLKRPIESDDLESTLSPISLKFRWLGTPAVEGIEEANATSTVVTTLCRELGEQAKVQHVRPKGQPLAVHDVSERLFSAYHVEGGVVRLVGCNLEDIPFLRLTFLDSKANRATHLFFSHEGRPVPTKEVVELGMDDVAPAGPFPPRLSDDRIELLLTEANRQLEAANASQEQAVATLVWVKHVTGKLEFTIDDARVDLPFSGWAKTLASPPFACEASGLQSFHVAKTDVGRIVAAEAIAVCEKSGKRVVIDELVQCSVTGKKVLERYVSICPVTGEPALKECFDTCTICLQSASQKALVNGICKACRSLSPVRLEDSRLVWLLGEYPPLERFRKWSLSETANVFIVQASTLLKRILLVVDKETMEVFRAAKRGAFSKAWSDLEPIDREELLGKP